LRHTISPLVCVDCNAVPGCSNTRLFCGEVGDRKAGRKRHLEVEAECGRSKEESKAVERRVWAKGRGAVTGGEARFN
jgi:hypothetical protein